MAIISLFCKPTGMERFISTTLNFFKQDTSLLYTSVLYVSVLACAGIGQDLAFSDFLTLSLCSRNIAMTCKKKSMCWKLYTLTSDQKKKKRSLRCVFRCKSGVHVIVNGAYGIDTGLSCFSS